MRTSAARGIVAFVVGFSGAALAVLVADVAGRPVEAERVAGEIDFFLYCRSTIDPDAKAILIATDAFGWRCAARRNRVFGLEEIDVDAACRLQYGGDARAASWDVSDPDAWQCLVGSG